MKRLPAAAGAVASLLLVAGCGAPGQDAGPGTIVVADTVDPDLTQPGTVFRIGPATAEAINQPVFPPVVVGRARQISIYEGFFVQAPCASLPHQEARLDGDTITVRLVSRQDTAREGPCRESEKPLGYAMLVGRFDPGTYAVRLIHEGDRARPTPLDTVYEDIAVKPE